MFEKLKRAKTFIAWGKSEEPKELDLTECSHLRRNTPITTAVLERQKSLKETSKKQQGENVIRKRPNSVQISKQQEDMHDKVLEQLKRINFGEQPKKNGGQTNPNPKKTDSSLQRHRNNTSIGSLTNPDTLEINIINKRGKKKPPESSNVKVLDEVLGELAKLDLTLSAIEKETGKYSSFDRKNFAYISEKTRKIQEKFHHFKNEHDLKNLPTTRKGPFERGKAYASERNFRLKSVIQSDTNQAKRSINIVSNDTSSINMIGPKIQNLNLPKLMSGHTESGISRNNPSYKSEHLPRRESHSIRGRMPVEGQENLLCELKQTINPREKTREDNIDTEKPGTSFDRFLRGYSSERNFSKQRHLPVFDRFKRNDT